jgi:hypothetical protein
MVDADRGQIEVDQFLAQRCWIYHQQVLIGSDEGRNASQGRFYDDLTVIQFAIGQNTRSHQFSGADFSYAMTNRHQVKWHDVPAPHIGKGRHGRFLSRVIGHCNENQFLDNSRRDRQAGVSEGREKPLGERETLAQIN